MRRRPSACACARSVQMVFQNPYGSLNPRKKIGAILEAPLAISTDLTAGRAGRPRARDAGQGRAAARALRALSAHVLGRPAAADRDRARADAQSGAGRRGRAGVRARRLGAGAGAEPARRPAGASSASPISSSRTTSASCATSRTTCSSCTWASRWNRVRRSGSSRGRCTRTRRRCSRRPRAWPGSRDPQRIVLKGERPSPLNPPSGCVFSTRCAYVIDRCRAERPVPRPLDGRHGSLPPRRAVPRTRPPTGASNRSIMSPRNSSPRLPATQRHPQEATS